MQYVVSFHKHQSYRGRKAKSKGQQEDGFTGDSEDARPGSVDDHNLSETLDKGQSKKSPGRNLFALVANRMYRRMNTQRQRIFDIFFELGHITLKAQWRFHGDVQRDMEELIIETFHAAKYWPAVEDRDPLFMCLKPAKAHKVMVDATGLEYMMGANQALGTVQHEEDVWALLTEEEQLHPGCIITVADPAWRALLYLAMDDMRVLETLRLAHERHKESLEHAHEHIGSGSGAVVRAPPPPPPPLQRPSSQAPPPPPPTALPPAMLRSLQSHREAAAAKIAARSQKEQSPAVDAAGPDSPKSKVSTPGLEGREKSGKLSTPGLESREKSKVSNPGAQPHKQLPTRLMEQLAPELVEHTSHHPPSKDAVYADPEADSTRINAQFMSEDSINILRQEARLMAKHHQGDQLTSWRTEWAFARSKINSFVFHPRYRGLSWYYMSFIQFVIVFAVMNCLVHSQESMTEPSDWDSFYGIETFCVSVFLLDFVLRLIGTYRYTSLLYNFVFYVDIITFVPFFVDRARGGVDHRSAPGFYILQVIRLLRLLKLFRFTQGLMAVFVVTFRQIWLSLLILVCYTAISVVVLASAMWYIEASKNPGTRVRSRVEGYLCPVPCPSPETLAEKYAPFYGIYDGCQDQDFPSNITMLFKRPTGPFKQDCEEKLQQSPLLSIPAAMYFAMVTVTTVGYGDISPLSGGGKLVAALGMVWAMLVVALPVSVVAGRFDAILKRYESIFGRMAQLDSLGIHVDYRHADEQRQIDHVWKERWVKIRLLRTLRRDELEAGSSDDEDQLTEDLHGRVVYRVSRLPADLSNVVDKEEELEIIATRGTSVAPSAKTSVKTTPLPSPPVSAPNSLRRMDSSAAALGLDVPLPFNPNNLTKAATAAQLAKGVLAPLSRTGSRTAPLSRSASKTVARSGGSGGSAGSGSASKYAVD